MRQKSDMTGRGINQSCRERRGMERGRKDKRRFNAEEPPTERGGGSDWGETKQGDLLWQRVA